MDFTVPLPESFRYSIVGPSGCGTTCLLKNLRMLIIYGKLYILSRSMNQFEDMEESETFE